MQRRHFLGLFLAAFAAHSAFAANGLRLRNEHAGTAAPPANEPGHVLFIGLGGGGSNVAFTLAQVLAAGAAHQITDYGIELTEAQRRAASAQQYTIWTLRDADSPAVLTSPAPEPAHIARVVLIAGLGANTGGKGVVELARHYAQQSIPVSAAVTTPFDIEGRVRRRKAREQMVALSNTGCDVHVHNNQQTFNDNPPSTSLLAAFRQASAQVALHAMHAAWSA